MTADPVRRVRLDLAYDGTDFAGWQRQPRVRTVQGALEEALAGLGARHVPDPRVRGAGRTDAGAHATRQVADAAIAGDLDDGALCRALRRLLPPDVCVRALTTAPDAFHPRRDAVAKCYRYRLDRTPGGDPFRRRWAWSLPFPLDEARVRDAVARVQGTHDFAGFAGAQATTSTSVRTVALARYEVVDGAGVFTFVGDGFLNHMVRNLVGTLVDIGRGRFDPGRIEQVLRSGQRREAGVCAPAHGLCLEGVAYHEGALEAHGWIGPARPVPQLAVPEAKSG